MEIPDEVMADIAKQVFAAINLTVDEIKNEVGSQTLGGTLYAMQTGPATFEVISESPVWSWLNDGTGIFNPAHAGAGPGGAIVPINAKALHFKSIQIAAALGFPSEDVFLSKVKGIAPRYFFERMFFTSHFNENFDRAAINI